MFSVRTSELLESLFSLLVGDAWLMELLGSLQVLFSLVDRRSPASPRSASSSEAPLARVDKCLRLTCFQVHGFHFNFSFYFIILLNLYSGNSDAFQK